LVSCRNDPYPNDKNFTHPSHEHHHSVKADC
jgi:hypothetical protein